MMRRMRYAVRWLVTAVVGLGIAQAVGLGFASAPPAAASAAGPLDPPICMLGLGEWADRVAFEVATGPVPFAAIASPSGGRALWIAAAAFDQEPPWRSAVAFGDASGGTWRLVLGDHANVAVDARWVTEQVALVRVWWGRAVEAELLVSVEEWSLIHAVTYFHFGAAAATRDAGCARTAP